MKLKKWEVLSSKYLVDNRWLKLRKDKCRLPNGNIINDFFVTEYANWANVLALTPNHKIVMVRQYRHGRSSLSLELPGGIIEKGQTPLDAIQRELIEETGYESSSWRELGFTCANPDNHTNSTFCFLALDAIQIAKQKLDKNESMEVELHSLNDVINMCHNGDIEQSMHITTIFRALKFL